MSRLLQPRGMLLLAGAGFAALALTVLLVGVHPADAARIGLVEGDYADVTSEIASVRLPVALLDDLMPGTVALPHGWGHQHAAGLSVAGKTRGVNVNILAADGAERIDRLSGMARLTGIEVDVRPAAGAPDFSSWSGMPAGEG